MPLDGVDLDEMVSRTDGYVGADLEMICREAGLAAYREDREAAKVTMAHFLKALSEVPPSVSQAQFDFYDGYGRDAKKRRTSWDKTPFYG
jgi:transitional endoplasmic reticulum ATPase